MTTGETDSRRVARGGRRGMLGPHDPRHGRGNVADSARRKPRATRSSTPTSPRFSRCETCNSGSRRTWLWASTGSGRRCAPAPPADLVSFDDPSSFDLDVSGAHVHLIVPQVEALLNKRIFVYPNANVRNLRSSPTGRTSSSTDRSPRARRSRSRWSARRRSARAGGWRSRPKK